MTDDPAALLAARIVEVADWPRPGVNFKDLSGLWSDPEAFRTVLAALVRPGFDPEVILAVEARGFLLGAPLALALGVPVVPVRKAGKLPRETLEVEYELEYGRGTLAVHQDAPAGDRRVLVVDDVLATGGTARAACALARALGASEIEVAVLVELQALGGRPALAPVPVHAVLALA